MNKLNKLIFLITFSLLFISCKKEEVRLPNFIVEFATVIKTDSATKFKLDNGNILKPTNIIEFDIANADRVLINYTPLEEKESIKINSIQKIFLGQIEGLTEDAALLLEKTCPIDIKSLWVSGNYLNLSFLVDYHSKKHSVKLLREDLTSTNPSLYLFYSRENDPLGAPTLWYLSFNIESLRQKNFTLYIKTEKGKRKFEF